MQKRYLLGLDNGGTVVKAALYDVEGHALATSQHHIALILPRDDYVERSCDEVWQANAKAIREVLKTTGVSGAEILGVGVAGHGNGAYLLGAEGNPTYNAIMSADTRAKAYVKKWQKEGIEEAIYPSTRQTIWAGQTTPILAWLQDNEPEALRRTRHVLLCKDFVRYCLTGEVATDITDISAVNALNLQTRQYDAEVFRLMGIEALMDKLPQRIASPTELCGRVTARAAAQTGLEEGTPVCGGMFDVAACAISTGVRRENQLCVIIGTWSVNECIAPKPPDKSGLFLTSLYALEGQYLLLEGSTTGASNLQWFIDNHMQTEKAQAEARGESIYDVCNAILQRKMDEESSLLFMPFLFGSNAHIDAKAGFVGLTGRHTREDMLLAVYEGVVFSHRCHVDRLKNTSGVKPACVRLAGGGASSRPWVQMFADVLRLPMEVSLAKELGAMGVCMCAGVMQGEYADLEAAMDAFSRTAYVVQPRPDRSAYYERKYQAYLRLLGALHPIWDESNR